MKGDYPHDPEALIDILVPADTSRSRENVRVGDDLFTTEVPGLDLAIARPPVTIALDLHRLNGQTLRCDLPFADELSALVLKGLATRVRVQGHGRSRCLAMLGDSPCRLARARGLCPRSAQSQRRSDPGALQQPPWHPYGSARCCAAPFQPKPPTSALRGYER